MFRALAWMGSKPAAEDYSTRNGVVAKNKASGSTTIATPPIIIATACRDSSIVVITTITALLMHCQRSPTQSHSVSSPLVLSSLPLSFHQLVACWDVVSVSRSLEKFVRLRKVRQNQVELKVKMTC